MGNEGLCRQQSTEKTLQIILPLLTYFSRSFPLLFLRPRSKFAWKFSAGFSPPQNLRESRVGFRDLVINIFPLPFFPSPPSPCISSTHASMGGIRRILRGFLNSFFDWLIGNSPMFKEGGNGFFSRRRRNAQTALTCVSRKRRNNNKSNRKCNGEGKKWSSSVTFPSKDRGGGVKTHLEKRKDKKKR